MKVIHCDFSNPMHTQAVINLMNAYLSDAMGGKLPLLTLKQEEDLITGLRDHPSKLVLLVEDEQQFIGLTNCFINFGTFACRPFINIHDLVVLPASRGKGAGKLLMQAIELEAQRLNCAKITLEVRDDNTTAQALYSKTGYGHCEPPMLFWVKYL